MDINKIGEVKTKKQKALKLNVMANVIKGKSFSILQAIRNSIESIFYGFKELGSNNQDEDIELEEEVKKIREQEHKNAISNLEKQVSPKLKKLKVDKSKLEYRKIERKNDEKIKEINREREIGE